MKYRDIFVVAALMVSGCASSSDADLYVLAAAPVMAVGDIANAYIKLTLEAGTHEAEYVDADRILTQAKG